MDVVLGSLCVLDASGFHRLLLRVLPFQALLLSARGLAERIKSRRDASHLLLQGSNIGVATHHSTTTPSARTTRTRVHAFMYSLQALDLIDSGGARLDALSLLLVLGREGCQHGELHLCGGDRVHRLLLREIGLLALDPSLEFLARCVTSSGGGGEIHTESLPRGHRPDGAAGRRASPGGRAHPAASSPSRSRQSAARPTWS